MTAGPQRTRVSRRHPHGRELTPTPPVVSWRMRANSEERTQLRRVSASAIAYLWIAFAVAGCGPDNSATPPTASQDPTHPSHSAAGASPAPAQAAAPVAGQEVEYGALVDFTIGGGSEPLKVSGWSKPETGFTWTQGSTATLAARVKPTDSPVTMRFKAAGMIKPPDLPFQPVEVFVNNDKVAELQIADTAEFNVAIPQGMTKAGGLLTITFRTPKAASPKALGQNEDERVLGIRVFNLTLDRSA